MHYSVPDAANLLGVAEDLVYDWIRNEGLPATFFGGRYHLNFVKLIDWAHRNRFPLPVHGSVTDPVLEGALEAGGALYNIRGENLKTALQDIFQNHIDLEKSLRNRILAMLGTRDNFGWSINDDGIGIPLSGSPLAVLNENSRVYIAYPETRSAPRQAEPFRALVVILVSGNSMHLNLLSRCLFAFRDPNFRAGIAAGSDARVLIDCLRAMRAEPVRRGPHASGAIDLS